VCWMSQTHDISGRKRRVIRKAKFEPQVALAVAEAIDNAMTDSKFVTVPILDARLAELREGLSKDIAACNERIGVTSERLLKEIGVTNDRTRADLVKWVLLAMLGSVAISAGAIAVNQTIEHYYH
jgi:hypothetical protein